MYFAVFKAKFCGVYDGKWGFYSTQTYLTLLRLWIYILFDTQTFDSVYLSNVNNRFSIKTGYRYRPLDINALAEEEQDLEAIADGLHKICTKYKVEISAENTK